MKSRSCGYYFLNPHNLIYLLLDILFRGRTADIDEIRLGESKEFLIEAFAGFGSITGVDQKMRIEERLAAHRARLRHPLLAEAYCFLGRGFRDDRADGVVLQKQDMFKRCPLGMLAGTIDPVGIEHGARFPGGLVAERRPAVQSGSYRDAGTGR